MRTQQIAHPKKPSLSGSEKIWRYMSLSRLLSLIHGNAFIPKLSELQKGDRTESKVVQFLSDYSALKSLMTEENKKWFLEKLPTLEQKRIKKTVDDPILDSFSLLMLENIWLDELAKRRCVWCWFEGEHESMAMWDIYGRDGVAVQSTCQDVLGVLEAGHAANWCLFGRVQYFHRTQHKILDSNSILIQRPYFAKQGSYEHEREIRFVFRDDRIEEPGRHLRVNFAALVRRIVISPFLPDAEATAVMKKLSALIPDELSGKVVVSGAQSEDPYYRTEETQDETWHASEQYPFDDFDGDLPPALLEDEPPRIA